MRIALLLLASFGLSGCIPTAATENESKLAPPPKPENRDVVHRVEVTVHVTADGQIAVSGDGTINVKTQTSATSKTCSCGCSQDGCHCEKTDLAKRTSGGTPPASTQAKDSEFTEARREVVDLSELKMTRDIIVVKPASFRCPACELAVTSIRALGFDVIVEKRDGLSGYPQVKNRRGTIVAGLMADGFWVQGRDDVEAVRQLAK